MKRPLFIIIAIFVCLFSPFCLQGEPVSLDEVLAVGQGQLMVRAQDQSITFPYGSPRQSLGLRAAASIPCSIAGVREFTDERTGELLAYILDLQPQGYIVISPDTDIRPVIAYSFNCNFSMEETPVNILKDMVRTDLHNRLAALAETAPELKEENNFLWTEYSRAGSSLVMELAAADQWPSDRDGWILTAWAQGSPYNDNCPLDPDSGYRSVSGCVATAMGQIVNYWQYPAAVTFSSSDSYWSYYYTTEDVWIDAPAASFSGLDYRGANPSNSVIAQLVYACGVAVQMQYSSWGSGAIVADVAAAFTDKFSYSTATWYSSSSSLYSVLQSNMKNGQPAELDIDSYYYYGYRHAIVCDGYKSSGAYHLNFGWSGSSDGWYFLPSGMPAPYDWVWGGVVDIYPQLEPCAMKAGHACTAVTSAASTWYLAEGCTAGEFDTWILIQNPNSTAAVVDVTFIQEVGTPTVLQNISIGAQERYSILVDSYLPSANVSTKVESNNGVEVIAERAMYLGSDWRAGHDSVGSPATDTLWYFAEGCTRGGFETYILMLNPGASAVQAALTCMNTSGDTVESTVTVNSEKRATVRLNDIMPDADVSTMIISTGGIVAERAMYWGNWVGCHNALGISMPDISWYLAEGCTSGGFDTWILLQNPISWSAVTATLTFMKDDGSQTQITRTLNPSSRVTVHVDDILPASSFSTKITATGTIIVERSMYFDGGNAGHCSPAAASPATTWYLAEGCTTGGFDEWILIQNPNTSAASVTITFMRDDGATTSRSYTVGARSRTSVHVDQIIRGSVSTTVTSTNDVGIVVERAMYW